VVGFDVVLASGVWCFSFSVVVFSVWCILMFGGLLVVLCVFGISEVFVLV